MKTGTLIKRAQITRDTLRHYEREGVITAPSRLANGYRDYPELVLEEIRFIRLGQSVGLALSAIRRAIPYLASPNLGCLELRAVLETQMASIEEQLGKLNAAKIRLGKWLATNFANAENALG